MGLDQWERPRRTGRGVSRAGPWPERPPAHPGDIPIFLQDRALASKVTSSSQHDTAPGSRACGQGVWVQVAGPPALGVMSLKSVTAFPLGREINVNIPSAVIRDRRGDRTGRKPNMQGLWTNGRSRTMGLFKTPIRKNVYACVDIVLLISFTSGPATQRQTLNIFLAALFQIYCV